MNRSRCAIDKSRGAVAWEAGESPGRQGVLSLSGAPGDTRLYVMDERGPGMTTGVNLMDCAYGGANPTRRGAAEKCPRRSQERGETVPLNAAQDMFFKFTT